MELKEQRVEQKYKVTLPSIPADDPRFIWTRGADVQATWKRFGWTSPSEQKEKSNEG